MKIKKWSRAEMEKNQIQFDSKTEYKLYRKAGRKKSKYTTYTDWYEHIVEVLRSKTSELTPDLRKEKYKNLLKRFSLACKKLSRDEATTTSILFPASTFILSMILILVPIFYEYNKDVTEKVNIATDHINEIVLEHSQITPLEPVNKASEQLNLKTELDEYSDEVIASINEDGKVFNETFALLLIIMVPSILILVQCGFFTRSLSAKKEFYEEVIEVINELLVTEK